MTLPQLFAEREALSPRAEALRTLGSGGSSLTYAEMMEQLRYLGRALLHLLGALPDAPIALLSENRLEGALIDLACLANGLTIIPVPTSAPAEMQEEILRHSGARLLLASPLPRFEEARLPALKLRLALDGPFGFQRLLELGSALQDGPRRARAEAVRPDDLATVMYTSGTGGAPKGIGFSHRNVVSKRIFRSQVLPGIGPGDRFLAYLPLFHTFGRWFELLGALHAGATYCFARSPSLGTLLEEMAEVHPTVFVSVPSKWAELCDAADGRGLSVSALTGGALRFGLSAAGVLEPALFHQVQDAGIALCSGYGMTEACGGITMTPIGDYRDGSVGVPLPGLETEIATDGELRIRGPYVMAGYFRPSDGRSGLDPEGWFATGDRVESMGDGHLRLIGRKKDLFKNRKGQTVAPLQIEALFVARPWTAHACLIGDGREYNTLLLSPLRPGPPTAEELKALTGWIVSRNRALAPFERVVDFRRLERPFSIASGELTSKGSLRREAIEVARAEEIAAMYRQPMLALPVRPHPIRLPTWLLREVGAPRAAISWRERVLIAGERKVAAYEDPRAPGLLRLGDDAYEPGGDGIDLGMLFSDPSLWRENRGLTALLSTESLARLRFRPAGAAIRRVRLKRGGGG